MRNENIKLSSKDRCCQGTHKQFVDQAIALLPNFMWGGGHRMGGDDQTHRQPIRGEVKMGAIGQGSHHATFRVGTDSNGRARQHRLHFWPIQESIITTTHEKTETRLQDDGDDRSIAVLPIQTQQDLDRLKLMVFGITGRHQTGTSQFPAIVTIAGSPKR